MASLETNLQDFPSLKPQPSRRNCKVSRSRPPPSVCDSITSAGLALLTKLKRRSIIGMAEATQWERELSLFPVTVSAIARTLSMHARHLSLSRALASSPTAPTRPGRHLSQPNIHLLPAGGARIRHRDAFKLYRAGAKHGNRRGEGGIKCVKSKIARFFLPPPGFSRSGNS